MRLEPRAARDSHAKQLLQSLIIDLMECAERTRCLIVEAGLSVSELSKLTKAKYGTESRYFISDTFISTVRKGVSPHLCQIAALSEFTHYGFADLMRHFGFDLQQLTWLQMKLHVDQTVLITPHEHFTVSSRDDSRFLYAKIGQRDGMGFPEIMPGSVVRIDTTQTSVAGDSRREGRHPLYIVDHLRGLSCCYVTPLNDSEILLTPRYLPYPCLQYRLGEQARILGAVDAELRPLQGISVPNAAIPRDFERHVPIPAIKTSQRISELLRNARERVGLRFREAHDLARRVAETLKNDGYGIALGTLSDYEAVDTIPRHISKIFSLCAIYAIDLQCYLRSAGITANHSAMTKLREFGSQNERTSLPPHESEATNGRLPGPELWFPRSLIDAQSELRQGKSSALETYSVRTGTGYDDAGSSEVKSFVVDRHSTNINQNAWSAPWQRPVYAVRRRDGKCVYGFCTVTDGILTVHRDSTMNRVTERLYRDEAHVVGQVVTMLRSVGQRNSAV